MVHGTINLAIAQVGQYQQHGFKMVPMGTEYGIIIQLNMVLIGPLFITTLQFILRLKIIGEHDYETIVTDNFIHGYSDHDRLQ